MAVLPHRWTRSCDISNVGMIVCLTWLLQREKHYQVVFELSRNLCFLGALLTAAMATV